MKKILMALLLCCFMGSTAHAYYGTVTDSVSGRTIQIFDLGTESSGEQTTRTYVSQNAWFSDSKSFIVRKDSTNRLYRYYIDTHTAEPLFKSGLELDNAAVVGPDNRVYARCMTDGHIYVQPPTITNGEVELYMTLPFKSGYEDATASSSSEASTASDGEDYTENGLTFRLCNGNRWRTSLTVARKRGDKYCRATVCEDRDSGGWTWADYRRWRSGDFGTQMQFRVDNSLIPATQRNVTIEFDYYDDSNANGQSIELKYLQYNNGGTPNIATKRISLTGSNTWKTGKFVLADAQFSHNVNSGRDLNDANGQMFDFQLGLGGNYGGFAASYVKVSVTDIVDLGYALGGWHPYVSSNGDLSLTKGTTDYDSDGNNASKIVIYEASKGTFAETPVWKYSTHAMINPKYPNLVLYSYDGSSEATTFGRINLFNRSTMFKGELYKQHKNSSGGATTGEAIGHEAWTPDGDYIVAVKYRRDTNVGKSGIVRMDKNGENIEYINDDYKYWHCDASADGRWIVAESTMEEDDYVKIVLIDSKTGKSQIIAYQPTFAEDPGQPHANFSPDGKKVTFAIDRRYKYYAGLFDGYKTKHTMAVAIVDVSDIVNDGQIAEPAKPTDFQISPFTVDFNKETGKNEISANMDNIDGQKRDLTLFAAVYDNAGKLISLGKKRYNSANDETIATDVDGVAEGQTIKCFVWNNSDKPIENSIGTIKKLRAARISNGEIVLSWQHESNVPVLKYEVFRGNINNKVGETPFTVYKDSGLSANTQYTYYVRPVYGNTFYLNEKGGAVSASLGSLNFEGIYAVLGSNPYKNYGVTFNENDNLAFDSYTEFTSVGGESCRYARQVQQGETDANGNKRWGSTYDGMFYFKTDRNVVKADTNKVIVGVRYYDARSGVGLGIQYKNTSGSTTQKTIVNRTGDNTWKTATITLDDAKFDDSIDPYSGYDFRIVGGWGTYISRVWVVPLDANGKMKTNSGLGNSVAYGEKAGLKASTSSSGSTLYTSKSQYVEWVPSGSSVGGLTTDRTDTTPIWINGNMNDWFKFSVVNGYMYGSGNNMAWIELTYRDSGTSKIYVYYNTSDPTANTDAEKASKPADTVITCTNTGEWKTATIPIIDADFSDKLNNAYDFAILVDSTVNAGSAVNGVTFKRVRVVGY